MNINSLNNYINSKTSPSPLVIFRIAFGLLIFFSILRFWSNGWIKSLYLDPIFHFSYLGFSWVKPVGNYTYLIFILCMLSSLGFALGYKYKLSSIMLFLSFTYIELMDKTTYLNHYYLISILAFMLIFLPAANYFSIDSLKNNKDKLIPRWSVDSIKVMLCIVYFYAGFAKINYDWLIHAQPLKIWLQGSYDIPLIGELLQKKWVHYTMSWGGMLYDCLIPFLLFIKRTRWFAFFLVVIFHVLTKVLFPAIGMFPYIMIISCLIFFNYSYHDQIILFLRRLFDKTGIYKDLKEKIEQPKILNHSRNSLYIIAGFLLMQILIPLRYKLYPGELFWTEQGYRFSWRVMLVEKRGHTDFRIKSSDDNQEFYVNNEDFLTPFQEKQMSFQPDFIVEFAQFLGDYYSEKGMNNVEVYVDAFATLNGRKSERLIDPKTNLYGIKNSILHKDWINPYPHEIIKL